MTNPDPTLEQEIEQLTNDLSDGSFGLHCGGCVNGPRLKTQLLAIFESHLNRALAEARYEGAESMHKIIFHHFNMLPRIQDSYTGDRTVDVRELQRVMCKFEDDFRPANLQSKERKDG